MIHVLQVLSSLHRNGTETSIMNVYRELDKSIFQFDFLVFNNQNMDFFDEIKSLGGNIYYIPSRRNNYIKYVIGCFSFFRKYSHKYNVVHFNFCYLNLLLPFLLARYYNIHTRICHSHSSSYVGSKVNLYLHLLFRRVVIYLTTHYLACSKEAAEWFYMDTSAMYNYKIISNGININRFLFNEDARKLYRNSLGLNDDDIIVGQIGYFSPVKNHSFTLSFMYDVFKSNSHIKLLLIGAGGSLEDDIISQVNASEYRDRIIPMESIAINSLKDNYEILKKELDIDNQAFIEKFELDYNKN